MACCDFACGYVRLERDHHLGEFVKIKGLFAITPSGFRLRVNLNDESVRTRGHTDPRQRRHKLAETARMAWICDHR
jgi:hypothetical protein